jgi:hypothetical protein
MVVPFKDATVGTAIYINPEFVVSVRPDPADPEDVSTVKLLRWGNRQGARHSHGGREKVTAGGGVGAWRFMLTPAQVWQVTAHLKSLRTECEPQRPVT